MARRKSPHSNPPDYRVKRSLEVLRNCGLEESDAGRAIGYLTAKERKVVIDAIRERKPVEEIVPRYYSSDPRTTANLLWSRSLFREAFVSFLTDNGSSPQEVLDYVLGVMRGAKRTVIKNGRQIQVDAPDIRLQAARILLERFAPIEKHSTVDIRSQKINVNLSATIDTRDAIAKLRAIEEKIRELDAREAVENKKFLAEKNDEPDSGESDSYESFPIEITAPVSTLIDSSAPFAEPDDTITAPAIPNSEPAQVIDYGTPANDIPAPIPA